MLARLFCIVTICVCGSALQALDTRASAAFVFDQTTGTILMEKEADEPLPPASMSKLMTLLMTFEALRDGRLSIDEKLRVSEHAMSFGGSTMFLDTTDRITVEDLIRGVIVLSGNDACVVLAEALSPDGTEAGFARMMTARARELGMMNSTFMNSSGWPAAGHRMSMRDLGILAEHLIADFPTFYPLFAEREFAFDGRAPGNTRNRNPLLGLDIGADGLKTGHTQEAGYGLVGSARQGDRRVIFVISGLDSAGARAEEAEKIVNWAFRQFAEKTVAKAGTEIARADVWMGAAQSVGLTSAEDLSVLIPNFGQSGITSHVEYTGPIEAPIALGQEVAELVIRMPDLPAKRVPLVAMADVPRGGFLPRIRTATQVLMGTLGGAVDAPEAEAAGDAS